jgi:hypothetical protein
MLAELLDSTGQLTGTRCGATSLSADGVLRRDDEIVARLSPTEDGITILDGAGHDTLLVIRDHAIHSSTGELRFRQDASTITSPDAEAPTVETTPATADPATALALFATLLVCNDLLP